VSDQARRRGPRPRFILAALALFAALVAAIWLYDRGWPGGAEAPERPVVAPDSLPAAPGARTIRLSFGDREGDAPVIEAREVAPRERLEDELLDALTELCAGPSSRDAVGVMPPGARPLSVFYDERQGAVVLDFSAELKANHPGGSAAEQATVAGILRTVALNFPEVRSCLILVGGAQVETLAGHIGLDRPFDPRRWL